MSTDHSKSGDVDVKSRKIHKRDDVVRWAVGILENQKDYRNMKVLGRGTYGDVRLMYDPERESAIAVKIVTSENISESELVLWPKLQHPNIVPLLELMTLSVLDVAIFIMPVQSSTLNDVMGMKNFLKHCNALDKVTKWLYQILCGLDYLHSEGLCHLDIKVDNVLISDASVAKLCDFTFLNTTARPLERYDLGLPYIYRPPEVCPTMGPDVAVNGKSYDMWSFGVMALEIFTHFYLASNLQEHNCWIKDIYPTMFDILRANKFFILMYKTFIGVRLKRFYSDEALDFVHGFLKVDNRKRLSPLEATQHPFLKKGTITAPPPDDIWLHKVQPDDESCTIFKERCLKILSLKDKTVYTEEDLYDSDMDYEASDECSYTNSNATDVQSQSSNDDDIPKKSNFCDNNPAIDDLLEYIETDKMTIGVTSEGARCNSSEDYQSCKKIKLHKNSLPRSAGCKKECEQSWVEENDSDYFKEETENKITLKPVVGQTISNLPIEKELNLRKEDLGRFNEESNNENTIPYTNEIPKLQSSALKIEYSSDTFQGLSDLEEQKGEFLSKDTKAISSMDFRPTFSSPELLHVSSEASKDNANELIGAKYCQSNKLCGLHIRNSKWATGDSIKDKLDFSEKLSLKEKEEVISNLSSETDSVPRDPAAATRQMMSLRQRLGEFDQILDDMQKVMVCMNCSNSKDPDLHSVEKAVADTDLDSAQKAHSTVSDMAAGGENCLKDTSQNTFGDKLNDSPRTGSFDFQAAPARAFEQDSKANIDDPLLQAFVFDALGENKNEIIEIGNSRKLGRRRKFAQWIRNKYLELERVVKRCPYKRMSEKL